jgi:3-oxoacyl-[acyl-carrier-protein] synthase-1
MEGGTIQKVDPFTAFRAMSNTTSAAVANLLKVTGRSYSIVSACSTGAHAIGHGYELIALGRTDRMIVGAGEDLSAYLAGGFQALRLALSTHYNDRPEAACRPYDAARDGVVLAGGAAILVLEALELALARGARIRAEVVGFGANSEGYDLVVPEPEGRQAAACIEMALDDAGLGPADIGYVNTHGTATIAGDLEEVNGLKRAFGSGLPPFSSTKSMAGHSLGASGAHEAAFSILMLEGAFLAPSINIDALDRAFEGLPIVRRTADQRVDSILSLSFGFGGANGALVLKRFAAA